MQQRRVSTPLGNIILFADSAYLYGAYFDDASDLPGMGSPVRAENGVSTRAGGAALRRPSCAAPGTRDSGAALRVLDHAEAEFEAYFAGRLMQFSLPLERRGSDFQQAIWSALVKVPFGATVSYGGLATQAGRSRAARAVGGAVGSNPWIVVVPCHRVLGAGQALGGFSSGLERKRALLQHEGLRWRE